MPRTIGSLPDGFFVIPSDAPDRRQPRTLLLTRPIIQSLRFAADFRRRFGEGFEVLIAPMMAIEPLPVPDTPFAALIFTSSNAGEVFAAQTAVRGPAWCVGDRTAATAAAAGFAVRSAGGDAAALVTLVRAARPEGPVLHLRGNHARGDVTARLTASGIDAREAVIYRQVALPLSTQAQHRLLTDAPVLLPLFSPRSAALFRDAARNTLAQLHVAAMSATVAAEAPPAQAVRIAARPDEAAMLDALGALLGIFDARNVP